VLSLGKDTLTMGGTASMSGKGLALDLDVSAERIGVAALLALAGGAQAAEGITPKPDPAKALNVYGALRLRAASVALDGHAAEAVAMTVRIGGGRTTADLERATICGVSIVGRLQVDDRGVEIALQPQAHGRRLDEDFQCFFPGDLRLTGSYDLSGNLTARGGRDSLLRSLQGSFDFSARKGRISNDRIVRGVLAYIDSTPELKGTQAALLKEGVPYEAVSLRGTLRDGVVSLAKVAIRSKELEIAAEGNVDLNGRTLALNVLVAPLTGIRRVLSKIPIVKDIAGNALIVVPARVEGSFDKPEVKHLPLSSVGASVTNLMKNIVEAPVKIIDPKIP
jgi:uncharacterized protein YhdP